ncbi:MAG TPA: penicillin acylase family protein [Acidimicrobiales bacterium]|nr:penicillin acylase family protein [Acidimicrobiales bacterium]
MTSTTTEGTGRYRADVRWTTHGVAHVRAEDWGSLGFGQGWALARDHLPTLADQVVKVRSERARYHGAGVDGAHLASDMGYLALGVVARAEALRSAQTEPVREMVTGYVAGCNTWLAEARETDALPPWCAEAEWIRPISELDLYAYLGDMALMGSGRNLAGIIGRAEAPGPDGPVPPSPVTALGGPAPGASNGWAFGGDATRSGHGMVMANPHFPWGGEARFWECHLTIPGTLDVYGVALLGTPGVQMGFNSDIAWAHTFSKGHRFTLARLDLVPGRPTSYRHGDDERDMVPATYAVDVRGDDGQLTRVERTLWSTHHGPMVNLPLLGWGLDTAFTYRDANLDNTAVIEQFLGMDRARSMDDLQRVFAEVQGLPWVNTLAADRTGRCWYIDASATPNLSPEAEVRYRQRVETDFVAALLLENRVALLDGSDPGDDWVDEDGARSPGLVPHTRLPQVERRDVVVNANDSHWLTHPDELLEGYSPLHGFERTPRTLRTRQNLKVATGLAASGDVTVEAVAEAVLANESLSAELLRDAVVARARAAGKVEAEGQVVDVAAAAEVLAGWDGRYDLASRGAALWREVVAGFAAGELLDAGPLFGEGWDPADPVATPRDLAPAPADGDDPVVGAVARAVVALDRAGVALDAPLGDVQWAQRGEHRVPVHGGGEVEGVLNVLGPTGALSSSALEPGPPPLELQPGRTERTGLTAGGYRCTYGTSFFMVVEMTDDGPRGQGLLAYGQSGDPGSPHHVDGTEAYAAKATRPLLFSDTDIEADVQERRTLQG